MSGKRSSCSACWRFSQFPRRRPGRAEAPDAGDPGRQVRGQQPVVGRLGGQLPQGGQAVVDRYGSQALGLELGPIAMHQGFVERTAGLAAVPGEETLQGGGVDASRVSGDDGVQD